jgi:GT2 family glycosyltransferase
VDADMCFEANALNKLIELNKDISSATYNYREYPKRSIVSLSDEYVDEYIVDDTVTERPIPLEKIKNPFRCKSAGGGFILIKTDVFRSMKRPWFYFEPQTETAGPVGEDVWFCDKARQHGYDIWVEPSIEIGHIGTTIF